MKKIYFRILAICLSLVLSFSILYKDSIQADALEWVGVAVGYDTAFKFLLGLLGVSVGVGVAENVDWGTMRQNAIQVQLDQGNSQAEISEWWSDVIHGSINTASSCWDSFKDYVQTLVPSSSGGGGSVGSYVVSSAIETLLPNYNSSSLSSDKLNFTFDCAYCIVRNGFYTFYFYSNASMTLLNNGGITIHSPDSSSRYTALNLVFTSSGSLSNDLGFSTGSSASTNAAYSYVLGYNQELPSVFYDWVAPELDDSTGFEALYPNIGDIALNPENADTLATDVIPLPWENIGASDTDIEGIIDDAISRVIDGTMSLENYWKYVQNITNTYAYSIENNYLLPNENGEDKKADDKVKENSENGAFVLYGLEKVFPFCIPFDIYAFITLLKADPVAPVIEYLIYNPVTQENEIITIDFSEWESVVIIFRYIFDFLLIIGLLLLARPLVGAGGDS